MKGMKGTTGMRGMRGLTILPSSVHTQAGVERRLRYLAEDQSALTARASEAELMQRRVSVWKGWQWRLTEGRICVVLPPTPAAHSCNPNALLY